MITFKGKEEGMRTTLSTILLTSVILTVSAAATGELSDYYTPYGFRLPLLQQGQYVISGTMSYYKSESEVIRADPLPRGSEGIQRKYLTGLSATYAISDDLLFQSRLYYVPKQHSVDWRSWRWDTAGDSLINSTEDRRDRAYFYPSFTLVYRLAPNFELYGDARFESYKSDYESNPETISSYKRSKYSYSGFVVGFTYLGKL
ncbi:MAG: hypothetical protein JSU65_05625 [Candidatus Zixiibacteriota bacterium]|nr:MAG: hypothetical protein JSU65_05625 [candidate division Zixibacteria bacterium]